MKTCPSCRIEKPVSEYGRRTSRKDGIAPYCKPCSREKVSAFAKRPDQQAKRKAYYEANKETPLDQANGRRATRRELYEPARQKWSAEHREEMFAWQRNRCASHREFVDALKAGKPCADCEWMYPLRDGLRPRSWCEPAQYRTDGESQAGTRVEEIAKCDLVCCVCHRIRTHGRRLIR